MDEKDRAGAWAFFYPLYWQESVQRLLRGVKTQLLERGKWCSNCVSPKESRFPSNEQGTSQGLWHTRVCLFEHPGRALLMWGSKKKKKRNAWERRGGDLGGFYPLVAGVRAEAVAWCDSIVEGWKVMFELCFSQRNVLPSNLRLTSQGIWHTRAKKVRLPACCHLCTSQRLCPL